MYARQTVVADAVPKEQRARFELVPDDAFYPEILSLRENAPHPIYGIGREDALGQGIAIIGARNATPYGKRIAKLVATWAADLGLVVYSGGARGCDQVAHQGALEAGGSTVAVMGCGADIVYPSRSGKLLDEIAQDGAVISEYPWQSPPMKYRFRQRNRLIAALSDLVVVVEARLPSGTLSTVHHALDMGVPVAAVPGSILHLESAAPNRLISEGAFPICCRDDLALACNFSETRSSISALYEGFEAMAKDGRKQQGGKDRQGVPDMNPQTSVAKVTGDAGVQTRLPFESELESHAGKIFTALRGMPALPDELARDLDLSLGEVLETLGHFEVQGHVIRYPDGRYGSCGHYESGDSLC